MSGDGEGERPGRTRTNLDPLRKLAPGAVLAERYRIDEICGVGGMGLVYRAHDEQLDLDVAVKVLRPEFSGDDGLIERFRRELILGRQVSHPNVVRIHDIGHDDDLYFLTMDYVPGVSLRDRIEERGRLDEAEALAILRQLAQALAAAHRAGVIHRDLKPSNVLVDTSGVAHITDFGVARSIAATGPTHAGTVVGTPDYLSPEQARGEPADARSDLYALGVILFEMLSGELPFPGGSFAETVAQRIAGRPRDLHEVGAAASPGLRTVLRRCLEPSPARRYASAEELLADLDRLDRLGRDRARRVLVLAASSVLVVALGWGLWSWRQRSAGAATGTAPPRPTSIAVLPLADETGTPSLAWVSSGLAEMLAETLAQSPKLQVVDPARVSRTMEDLRLTPGNRGAAELARIGELLDADLVVVGSARLRGPLLRVDARLTSTDPGARERSTPLAGEEARPAALIESLAAALRENLDVPAPEGNAPLSSSDAALVAYHEGSQLLHRGDAVLAEPALERAVAADAGFGTAWHRLAEAYAKTGKSEPAIAAATRAVATLGPNAGRLGYLARALEARLRGDPAAAQAILGQLVDSFPGDLEAAVALAETQAQQGDLTQAMRRLDQVVEAAPHHPRAWYLLGKYAILGGNARAAADEYLVRALVVQNKLRSEQGRADVLNAFGVAYRELGDLARAEEHYDQAAELRRALGDQRGYATSLRNRAQIETARGELDEAERTLRSAMEILDELGDRVGQADARNDLGVLEEQRGRYGQALEHYREALQLRREAGDRRAEAESLNNVGYAYHLLGELDNASAYWNQALDLYRETGNREGEILVTQSLGQLQLSQGQWDAAVKSYVTALEQARATEFHAASAVSLGYLGRAAHYQGRYAAALASYAEALRLLAEVQDEHGATEFALARADALVEIGRFDEARADLERVEPWIERSGNRAQRAESLRLRAALASAGGDTEEARRVLDAARKLADASQSAALVVRLDLDRAGVDLGRGAVDAARAALDPALERAERMGNAPLRLLAWERSAEARLRAGDTERAQALVARALRFAESCGTWSGAHRLQRLAERIARARGDAPAAEASRARAEQELARITDGLDPERAEALRRRAQEAGS